MAQNAYVGVGNKAREVSKMYIGTPNTRAHNILKNGTLSESPFKWEMATQTEANQHAGYLTIRVTSTATSGTFPNYQFFENTISGSTQETNRVIFSAAMVRGRTTNTGTPRVYLRRYMNGTSTIQYVDLRVDNRTDNANNLNDGNWHLLYSYDTTYWTNNYATYDRIAFGTNTATLNDEMDICNVFVCDVTETFGRGKEKDWAWLIDNLYYKAYNMIYNGELKYDDSEWVLSEGNVSFDNLCAKMVPLNDGTRPILEQDFETIEPVDSNEKIFACVEVKGSQSNTSYPVLVMRPSAGGGIYQSRSFDGSSKMELNDGLWHPMNLYLTVGSSASWHTMKTILLTTTFESGYNPSTTDEYYFRNARVYNLTKIYGAGKEPTEDWCKEHLFSGGFHNGTSFKANFSSNVMPRDWDSSISGETNTISSNSYYGKWIVTGKYWTSSTYESNQLDCMFDDDTSTYYHVGSISSNINYININLPCLINPSSFLARWAYSTEMYIEGFNYKTNQWVTLGSGGDSTSSSIKNITFNNSINFKFAKFRVRTWYGTNSAPQKFYNFEIKGGSLYGVSDEYLKLPTNIAGNYTAKRVSVAYIGVNGVAQRCFPAEGNYNGLEYYGTAQESLSQPTVTYNQACSVGNYALLMGGRISTDPGQTDISQAYNGDIVKVTVSNLSVARRNAAACSFDGKAIIVGGYSNTSTKSSTFDFYNSNLVRSSGSIDYSVSGNGISSTSDYCIIGGGDSSDLTNKVRAINKNMVYSVAPTLSRARRYISATSLNNSVLFCGGTNSSSTIYSDVDIYDNNLVKTVGTALSANKYYCAATSTDNHAFIMGGRASTSITSNVYDTVDVYDKQFVKTSGQQLSVPRSLQGSIGLPRFACCIGGYAYSTYKNVDVYTDGLVHSFFLMDSDVGDCGCAIAGGYAYVLGGSHRVQSNMLYTSTVQVLKLDY